MSLRSAAVALAILAAVAATSAAAGADEEAVPSIELRGALSPARADWVGHALNDAADADAPFAILRLDTPGGLDSAAEEIVDQIRAAPLPVVVYVYPGGATVEGQGASIVDAADVAAMAPGTTLEFEGNDLGENTAIKQGRIEMIASDPGTLLEKLDGYRVGGPKATTLSTSGDQIDDRGATLPFQLLAVLVDPNVAFLLLLIGLLGLTLEALAPGAIIPGAIGAAALVLGLLGTAQLPVAALGVVLLAAGAALILAGAKLRDGGLAGVAGAGGVAALIAGGLVIFDTGSAEIGVSPPFVVAAGAVLGLATVFVGSGGLRSGRPRPGPGPV